METTHHYSAINKAFKLNNRFFTARTLKVLAYSFVKEGLDFEKNIGQFLLDWLNKEAFIVVKTSGSTGDAKSIKLNKEAMVNSALATGAFFNLKPRDTALLCLPANYIAGKMMLVRAMVLGLELDCINPTSKIELNKKKQYKFAAMVPMQAQKSLNFLNAIEILILGGAPVSSLLVKSLQNINSKVFETYGMTETITHIALKPLNNFKKEKANFSAYFETLPDINISVDSRNCLVIAAPKLRDQEVVTNDVVTLVGENKFEWLGRFDNIINSGGIKINPEQIEKRLKLEIKERLFLASEKDEVLGEQLILILESEGKETGENYLKKIKKIKQLNTFEVPKRIIAVSRFIETSSGKINRAATMATFEK